MLLVDCRLDVILTLRDRNKTIHDLEFSPDGRILAAGSEDGFVDFYDSTVKFARAGYTAQLGSPVVHIDFAVNSRVVQVSLFFFLFVCVCE